MTHQLVERVELAPGPLHPLQRLGDRAVRVSSPEIGVRSPAAGCQSRSLPPHTHYVREVNYVWEQLADGVHRCRLPFLDVTVGLIAGETGALLVDTGTTLTEAAAIGADVNTITGQPVSHIVLTHKHFDHVLGSSGFFGAEIYCAPEVAEYLATATGEVRADAIRYGADSVDVDSAIAALRPPDHLVTDAVVDLGNRL